VDKPRVDKSRWSTTASGAEWAKVILRFRALTDLREPAARLRAKRAADLLKKEAKALNTAADELEFDGRDDPSPAKYQAERIARRVIKEGRIAEDVIAEYLTRWGAKCPTIMGTSTDLRALARDARRFAEVLALGPRNFLEWARKKRRGERQGALPSIAADYLIDHALEWKATQREVAERLYDAEVMPPSARDDNEESDPIARWMTILRSAWPRAKKRQTTE